MARKIAILGGTGPEGSGLANRLARAGEHIVIGSREAPRKIRLTSFRPRSEGIRAEGRTCKTGSESWWRSRWYSKCRS